MKYYTTLISVFYRNFLDEKASNRLVFLHHMKTATVRDVPHTNFKKWPVKMESEMHRELLNISIDEELSVTLEKRIKGNRSVSEEEKGTSGL